MTPKQQTFKMIEGRIETLQQLSTEIIELIYKAAYNEAIDDVTKQVDGGWNREDIIKLKKE